MRAIFLIILAILCEQIYELSGTNWRDEGVVGSPLEEVCKGILRMASQLPGLRLMLPEHETGFPLPQLSVWDTLLGCLFYSLAFVFVLWLATPLPDISIHFLLVIQFQDRERGPREEQEEIPIPTWHPGGGEGPVFNPPPPPMG